MPPGKKALSPLDRAARDFAKRDARFANESLSGALDNFDYGNRAVFPASMPSGDLLRTARRGVALFEEGTGQENRILSNLQKSEQARQGLSAATAGRDIRHSLGNLNPSSETYLDDLNDILGQNPDAVNDPTTVGLIQSYNRANDAWVRNRGRKDRLSDRDEDRKFDEGVRDERRAFDKKERSSREFDSDVDDEEKFQDGLSSEALDFQDRLRESQPDLSKRRFRAQVRDFDKQKSQEYDLIAGGVDEAELADVRNEDGFISTKDMSAIRGRARKVELERKEFDGKLKELIRSRDALDRVSAPTTDKDDEIKALLEKHDTRMRAIQGIYYEGDPLGPNEAEDANDFVKEKTGATTPTPAAPVAPASRRGRNSQGGGSRTGR